LHLRDLAALRAYRERWGLEARASIEPGADELAMASSALRSPSSGVVPRIRVAYSQPGGGSRNDPLEYAPIDATVDALIGTSGGRRADETPEPDIDLFVRVPGTSADEQTAFVDAFKTMFGAAPRGGRRSDVLGPG